MTQKKTATLLINTQSKKGQRSFDDTAHALEDAGYTLTDIHTMDAGTDLAETMKTIMATNPPLLIVGSGDGTVSAISGYLAHTDTVLGYIPLGTTNNFGRSLGIPVDINEAIDVITNGKVAAVNLGLIDGAHFVNMANFGVSMVVATGIPHTLKQLFGRASYGIYSIVSILKHRPLTITVHDNQHDTTFVTHQFSIANGSRHAGVQISADAHIDSNHLLAYTLGGKSRLSTMYSVIKHIFSAHLPSVKKGFLRARHMTITLSRPQRVELDGEIRTKEKRARYEFSVDVDALNVLVPQDFDDK